MYVTFASVAEVNATLLTFASTCCPRSSPLKASRTGPISSPFSRRARLSFMGVSGSKNFSQFCRISFSAASGSAGRAPSVPFCAGLGADVGLAVVSAVRGGAVLSSPHAVRGRARTAEAVSAASRAARVLGRALPRLSSLPGTIWLTTGCRSGRCAPGVFRVSFQKA